MEIISGEFLFLIFLFISSCFLILATARFRRSYSRGSKLPPGPPGLPIIGNILQISRNPHHSFANLSKIYGPIMSLKLGFLNSVVISSPEAAREVLRTHDQILSGRKATSSLKFIKHHEVSLALLPSSSARWRMLRKLSTTLMLSPQRTEVSKALRMKKVQELVNFVSESSERGEEVDISHASFTTSLNIMSNILFSVDIGSYDSKNSNEMQEIMLTVMKAVGKPDAADFFPILGFFDLQGNMKAMKVSADRLFRLFREIADAKIAKKSLPNDSKDSRNKDVLDSLLDLTEGDEAELDSNDIEHFLLDMFIGGTDENASTVEWTMAELLSNPEAMAKAQSEIDRLIGRNGPIQESDISQLPYLQAVVKENFRLHPPFPFLGPRKAEADAEVLGFMVPKDTQVLVNVWAIGRDPSVWENPSQFQPERFLGKEIDVTGRYYEFTPFGGGRRICPGLPLAMKVVPLMIASLLYYFDWKLPKGVIAEELDMDETFGITLHKTKRLHAIPVKKRPMN